MADFESTRVTAHYWVSSSSLCRVGLTSTIDAAGGSGPPRYMLPHCLGDSLSRGVRHLAITPTTPMEEASKKLIPSAVSVDVIDSADSPSCHTTPSSMSLLV